MSDQAESEKVARAVAAELNAAAVGGLTFTFDDSPDIDLKQLSNETLAHVRDLDDEMSFQSRSQTQHDYHVEIVLRRKVAKSVSPHVRQLKFLMQTIADYYRFRPSIADRTERFNRVQGRQIRDDDSLQNQLVMKASIILIFRGYRG